MAQLRKAREAAARKRALAAEAEHTDAPTDLGLGVNTGPRTRKTLAGLIAGGRPREMSASTETVGNMKALFAEKALYSASPILPQAAFPARGGAAGRNT